MITKNGFFFLLTLLCACSSGYDDKSLVTVEKPIIFTALRQELSKKYIQEHYGYHTSSIIIQPKMIVVHWTAMDAFQSSFNAFYKETLGDGRKDIASASALNVSVHYLVDRDGTIYSLMPDNWMARHVIGLNNIAIGIENVGGKDHNEHLTIAQVDANVRLIRYLSRKYPKIRYLIGHYEYLNFKDTPLWEEKDPSYSTIKSDPGKKFMGQLRENIKDLRNTP